MDRKLDQELVEGEIGLVIDYTPGVSRALDILNGAMALVSAIDALDAALLSSISTELEPVSILNDVQHSSLKMLLARVIKSIPDDALRDLEWRKWLGELLVMGKYMLLGKIDADAPQIEAALQTLAPIYKSAPSLIGYDLPKVKSIKDALKEVSRARSTLGGHRVIVQTELGDIILGEANFGFEDVDTTLVKQVTNRGREFLKVRSPDMLGKAQWTVMRNNRVTRVELLHANWLAAYQAREFTIIPGDSLDCTYEETVGYDLNGNEVERSISIIEVHEIVSPPSQKLITF